MEKRIKNIVTLIVALLIPLMVACAPSPATVTPSLQPPDLASKATPLTTTISPQEAEWARVVEAAKKEGKVTIYTSSALAGDVGVRTMAAFSSKYGIQVERLIAAGRQVVERVKIENAMKQPVADIVTIGTCSATELSLAGLLDNIGQELPTNVNIPR